MHTDRDYTNNKNVANQLQSHCMHYLDITKIRHKVKETNTWTQIIGPNYH